MSELEEMIAYLERNRRYMSWHSRLMFPLVRWIARKVEPYRQKRIARGDYDAARHADYHAGQG